MTNSPVTDNVSSVELLISDHIMSDRRSDPEIELPTFGSHPNSGEQHILTLRKSSQEMKPSL